MHVTDSPLTENYQLTASVGLRIGREFLEPFPDCLPVSFFISLVVALRDGPGEEVVSALSERGAEQYCRRATVRHTSVCSELCVCSYIATPAPHLGGRMALGYQEYMDTVLNAVNIGIANET